MKTAVIQINAQSDKAANIKKAARFVERAVEKGAQFILLPEVFAFRGHAEKKDGFQNIAEGVPGESLRPLMALAKKHKVFILAGSVYEKIKGKKKIYNTSVLIDDRGKVQAKYRKRNLFNADIGTKRVKESDFFVSGKRPGTARVKGFKIGMSICYDLRFPELYRRYALAGVDILCVPSAFTRETGKAHWETLLRARAIENLCYVLAPNQIGPNGQGIDHYGNSMIVDPWGKVLARAAGHKEGIVFADIKREHVEDARRIFFKKNMSRKAQGR